MTSKEAIEVVKEEWRVNAEIFGNQFGEALDLVIKALEERPQGEWIFKKFDEETGISNSDWCPFCGKVKAQVYDNFCGNCGAQLRGK